MSELSDDPLRCPDRPAGEPWVQVADISRSLAFFLDLGCEVRRAADGWVRLSGGPASFGLVQSAALRSLGSPPRRDGAAALVRLTTPDIRALRRRLLACGVPAGPITRPCHAPGGEMELVDPDGRLVVVSQSGLRLARASAGSPVGTSSPMHLRRSAGGT